MAGTRAAESDALNRCHITDRHALGSVDALLSCIARNDAAGVDLIQIREKDLSARDLCSLVQRALAVCTKARVLVNTRMDVALACGAHGAHLPSDSPAPRVWRPIAPRGFVIGVSCHSIEELLRAEAEGADYALFAPVFKPLSKVDSRVPHGIEGLRAACVAVKMPVYALGGITMGNAALCVEAGAAGVAGITLFQK